MTHRLYLLWKVTAKPAKQYSTYVCDICQSVNCSHRLHCQNCGTIPKQYSILNAPMRERVIRDYYSPAISYQIPVTVAWGAIRQTSHRTVKRIFRTVRADYYATA